MEHPTAHRTTGIHSGRIPDGAGGDHAAVDVGDIPTGKGVGGTGLWQVG